jgi:lactoylglutathione lyase
VIKRVDTIILLVRSIERSVEFYRERIGLPLKFWSPGWAEFVIGDVHLALHRQTRQPTGDTAHLSSTGVSLNLEVDDVEETLVRLTVCGINAIGGVKEYEFGRYFFVTDPDGYVVGFREYKEEYSSQSSV